MISLLLSNSLSACPSVSHTWDGREWGQLVQSPVYQYTKGADSMGQCPTVKSLWGWCHHRLFASRSHTVSLVQYCLLTNKLTRAAHAYTTCGPSSLTCGYMLFKVTGTVMCQHVCANSAYDTTQYCRPVILKTMHYSHATLYWIKHAAWNVSHYSLGSMWIDAFLAQK